MRKDTKIRWLTKLKDKHGDVCDYTLENIEDSRKEMKIYCKICKEYFYQSPENNFKSVLGCNLKTHPKSKINKDYWLDDLIKYSKLHNGARYDFAKAEYKGRYTPIVIFDNECQRFFNQTPNSHKRGNQCNLCVNKNKMGFYSPIIVEKNKDILKNKDGKLYILRVYDNIEQFYKIGVISQGTVKKRTNKNKLPYDKEIIHVYETSFYDVFYLEQAVLSEFSKHTYIPNKRFHGATECFNIDLDIDNVKKYIETLIKCPPPHTCI